MPAAPDCPVRCQFHRHHSAFLTIASIPSFPLNSPVCVPVIKGLSPTSFEISISPNLVNPPFPGFFLYVIESPRKINPPNLAVYPLQLDKIDIEIKKVRSPSPHPFLFDLQILQRPCPGRETSI
jgi:hypothetical protein